MHMNLVDALSAVHELLMMHDSKGSEMNPIPELRSVEELKEVHSSGGFPGIGGTLGNAADSSPIHL